MARQLTYRHIEAIRAVMRTGSVTGAAARLHVTQPAISHLLRDIDALLQFPLFERQAGRIIPTERATILLAAIERSFVGLDSINDVCRRLRVARQNTIAVALVPVASAAILPHVIAEYRDRISEDFFLVEALSNEQVLSQVAARKADIGIALDTTPVPGIQGELLLEFEARCLLPASHALAGREVVRAEELDGLPMIAVPRADNLGDPLASMFAEHGASPVQVVECTSATGACAMVEAGIGFALLDPVAAHPYRNGRLWIALFEPTIPFRFFAYWREGHSHRFDREALIAIARERCLAIDDELSPGSAARRSGTLG